MTSKKLLFFVSVALLFIFAQGASATDQNLKTGDWVIQIDRAKSRPALEKQGDSILAEMSAADRSVFIAGDMKGKKKKRPCYLLWIGPFDTRESAEEWMKGVPGKYAGKFSKVLQVEYLFTVEIPDIASEKEAENVVTFLKDKGFQDVRFSIAVEEDSSTTYKALVGFFTRRDHANIIMKKIRKKGFDLADVSLLD